MRNILKVLLLPAALAMAAGAGIATTAAPANAQLYLDFNLYPRPYYYAPYGYYYGPRCYWDAFYGRVCY